MATPQEQIDALLAIEASLDNPIDAEQIRVAKQLNNTLLKLEKVLPRFKRAGFDLSSGEEEIKQAKERLGKLIREFG